MGNMIYTDDKHYHDIASAVREKLRTETRYLSGELANAILSIPAADGRCPKQNANGNFMFGDLFNTMEWDSTSIEGE